jgi:5'-3' exonuclease
MKINLVFDGNFLYHLSFSIFSTYYRNEDLCEVLDDREKRQVLIRKCVMNLCAAVRRFGDDVNRVVVVIDSHSWRREVYDDYKYALTRVKEPWSDAFVEVLGEFEALLRKRGLIVTRVPGAEGDDLMMLWAFALDELPDEETVILTADSDIRQLITPTVSVFNYNSKFMKFYVFPGKEGFWNERLDADIQVLTTEALEVLLYKVLMGDKSDNIPKVRRGFGDKAFNRFIDSLKGELNGRLPSLTVFQGYSSTKMALWIQSKFEKFLGTPLSTEEIGQILFNVQLTWLSPSVYGPRQEELLIAMAEEIANTKDSYNYKKAYTLEDFYGMLIK